MRPVLAAAVALVLLPSCVYTTDRGRDLADCFTCEVGRTNGLKVRASGLTLGADFHQPKTGLAQGRFFYTEDADAKGEALEGHLLLVGEERTSFNPADIASKRHKQWKTDQFLLMSWCENPWSDWPGDEAGAAYYGQLEATLGICGGLKLGINAAEIGDLFLGIFGADLLDDDVADQEIDAD